MPGPAGGTQIPVIADESVMTSTTLAIMRTNGVSVSLNKPTYSGTSTAFSIGYVDEGTTISYTTSAKPGASTLHISVWYADGSDDMDVVQLGAGEVYTVPDNVIQIGLVYE